MRMSARERIERAVFPITESGCWIWMHALDVQGYGALEFLGAQNVKAHRLSWEVYRGPIPKGMHVCHCCDIPCCVNPDHLFLGTHTDNMRDKAKKGRAPRGESHCDAILTDADVLAIRRSNETNQALADRYGVGLTTLWKARNGVTWKHLPMPAQVAA